MGRIQIVPILYRDRDFGALGDFEDFLESVSYGTSKTCQVRGSNPCRGAILWLQQFYKRMLSVVYKFAPKSCTARPVEPARPIDPPAGSPQGMDSKVETHAERNLGELTGDT
jgi:hypothetical protein